MVIAVDFKAWHVRCLPHFGVDAARRLVCDEHVGQARGAWGALALSGACQQTRRAESRRCRMCVWIAWDM